MNQEDFRNIMKRGQRIGLATLQHLADFKKHIGAKSNLALLAAVNAAYCRKLFEGKLSK